MPVKGVDIDSPAKLRRGTYESSIEKGCIADRRGWGYRSGQHAFTISFAIDPPAFPAEFKGGVNVLDIGPEGIVFLSPITVQLNYTQEDLDSAGIKDPFFLGFFTYNPTTFAWDPVPVDMIDTEKKLLICKLEHFSLYTLGLNINEVGKIPDTGQTISYTETFGEDSDYSVNPLSYTKLDANGNVLPDSASSCWAMVKDNMTGLVWVNKTEDGSIHD
ncbi:MAG: hypothetical protein V2B19_27275 [Pseudomonadota bacterium]